MRYQETPADRIFGDGAAHLPNGHFLVLRLSVLMLPPESAARRVMLLEAYDAERRFIGVAAVGPESDLYAMRHRARLGLDDWYARWLELRCSCAETGASVGEA